MLFLLLLGFTATQARAGWSRCASEGNECYMSNGGHHLIRYGLNDKYFMLETFDLSHIACNGAVFGDPARGSDKFCDYTDLPDNSTWVDCASEGQNCQLPDAQPRNVRYGIDWGPAKGLGLPGGWVYKVGSSSIRCSNDEFPDIANGSAKRCQYSKQAIFPLESGQNSVKFKDCSTEDTVCNIPGNDINSALIRFGTGNSWEYRQADLPSVACNLDTFRVDVAPNQKKFCQYTFAPAQFTTITGEWKKVGTVFGGPLTMNVQVGVSATHTQSRTDTWAVEASLAIKQEFNYFEVGKTNVEITVKHSESVAKLMSDALTRQTSVTKTASCPTADKVDMYQWTMDVDEACYVRDGQCKSTVSSFNILCATNQPNDYQPICPPSMCTDKLCTVCTAQPAAR
jgi:hypothetical protein